MNEAQLALTRFFAIRRCLTAPDGPLDALEEECGNLYDNLRSSHAPLRNVSAEFLGTLAAQRDEVYHSLIERYDTGVLEEKLGVLRALWLCRNRSPDIWICLSEWIERADSPPLISRLLITMVGSRHPFAHAWLRYFEGTRDKKLARIVRWGLTFQSR